MEIVIDGNKDLAYAEAGSSLGEILDQLQTWLTRNGRAIVTVSIDGRTMGPSDVPPELRNERVDAYKTLDVVTLCPSELSLLVLSRLGQELPSVGTALTTAATHFQKGNLPTAMTLLRDAVTGLQITMDTLLKVGQLQGIEVSTLSIGGKSGLDAIHRLRDKLREVQAALKSKDSVTLADMAEYELAPAVKDWQELIGELEEKIRKQDPLSHGHWDTSPLPPP